MAKSTRLPDSGGHDILIWQKGPQTPTWVIGYSARGINYVRTFVPDYEGGKGELRGIYPEQFLANVPAGLKIGGILPGSRKTVTLSAIPLH
jgi:hypothetical protein